MIKIKLFCSAGMSTSMLVNKMREEAKKRNIEVFIEAYSETTMTQHIEDVDVVLLGPQISYKLPEAKKIFDSINVPVAVINMQDYGMMNGSKVLDMALSMKK